MYTIDICNVSNTTYKVELSKANKCVSTCHHHLNPIDIIDH